MTGGALGLKICLAGLGVADDDRRRPHASRIAAVNFEFVNERRDIVDLVGGEVELVLVQSGALEKRSQQLAIAVPHHVVGAEQIGAAVRAAARVLAMTISTVGQVSSFSASDDCGIAGGTRRELARALNRSRRP